MPLARCRSFAVYVADADLIKNLRARRLGAGILAEMALLPENARDLACWNANDLFRGADLAGVAP